MAIVWKDSWKRNIPENAIKDAVNKGAVKFAEEFGKYLALPDKFKEINQRTGKTYDILVKPLNTNQLRKFFGDVKRQQLRGYEESSFILLKPKLAYAVGRANDKDKNSYNKITDFAKVISNGIDIVTSDHTPNKEKAFENFIAIFEAIVAYHKAEAVEKN